MDTEKDLLDAYIKNLENQIGNKRYFLEQARSAIDEITNRHIEPEGKPTDPGIFAELLKKPMLLPERADPIGFSLVSNFLSSRIQTSSEWLSIMGDQSVDKKAMVSLQKNTNSDLKELLVLLRHQFANLDNRKQNLTHLKTSKVRNEELWGSLKDFVVSFLAPNMDNNGESIHILTRETTFILKRLIVHDSTVTMNDFSSKTMPIYRLLLRANIVTVTQSPTNSDVKYIKLIDFNGTGLT
ncbi:hypothetical protein SEUBUCD646_0J03250 [Saccharomyces eubayanus]|uniref:Minichromosome maintenance-protein n=2 Tax=Saccharomyces TaxID=4930 RepID=A0A6C1DVN9_SACPS|nr:minichromosome maintenance- protein [Saccharomyces pastorianus]CAI1524698.1 hypothetical protein SEUBUCD650_0J03240 [Saccharomyces eubayanus]CAI1545363.1 hypothetical protein SEUBUCD646_0J03250 [Saccharomyces eubayanus]